MNRMPTIHTTKYTMSGGLMRAFQNQNGRSRAEPIKNPALNLAMRSWGIKREFNLASEKQVSEFIKNNLGLDLKLK